MKEIKLTQGKTALVNDEDYNYLNQWNWYAERRKNTFYAARNNVNGGPKRMHIAIMGQTDRTEMIDHKDGNGLNNQRNNLRRCLRKDNSCNRLPKQNGTSIYIGVCWDKSRNKWVSQLAIGRGNVHFKLYDSEIDAALAYNEAAIKFHGEFASLNKVHTSE